LLAILPEFGLRVFQHPSGADIRNWGESLMPRGAAVLAAREEHSTEDDGEDLPGAAQQK
jgi:miniconductance mechanosensitive channel